jgi:hypothetical protein
MLLEEVLGGEQLGAHVTLPLLTFVRLQVLLQVLLLEIR